MRHDEGILITLFSILGTGVTSTFLTFILVKFMVHLGIIITASKMFIILVSCLAGGLAVILYPRINELIEGITNR